MTTVNMHIEDSFTIAPGVAIVLSKSIAITPAQLAGSLRQWIANQCQVGDDAGVDWFHDTQAGAICIGGPEWIVSTNATLANALALADMIDGRDFSVFIPPDKLVDSLPGKE